MNNKFINFQKFAFWIGQAGCVLFVLLTLLAMLTYPGGTYLDHYAEGYSFWHNFFSDLGRTETFLGEPNTLPFILFSTALSFIGLAFIIFFWSFQALFRHDRMNRILSKTGTVAGVISGMSFIGVALTPWDKLIEAHMLFVYLAFSCFLLVVIFYTISIIRSPHYQNYYGYILVAFALLLFTYIIILFNLGGDTPEAMVAQAVAQKIIVYSSIIIMFIQARGAQKVISTK